MSAVVPMHTPVAASDLALLYNPKDLDLIRRQVAKDATEDEFRVFIHAARYSGLDPLKNEIYCFIYNRGKYDFKTNTWIENPRKPRKMTIVTAISGFRKIAQDAGNYRADDEEAEYFYDKELIGPTNPIGLIKAKVKVWQYHSESKTWFPIVGVAYWDEHAPIKDEWGEDETGNSFKTGKQKLDASGQWGKMPRLMLAKVAEAAALRKAWPSRFSNVYAEEEIDRQKFIDLDPIEAINHAKRDAKLEALGVKDAIPLTWMPDDPMEFVPKGKVADRIFAFLEEHKDEPAFILNWWGRNRTSLTQFGHDAKSDAFEVKAKLEELTKSVHAPIGA
jgi:phage recombination protein Bet